MLSADTALSESPFAKQNHGSFSVRRTRPCKICLRPGTIEHGFKACEACKRFFKRTLREANRLTCISGTYNCQPAPSTSSDRNHRQLNRPKTYPSFVCRHCRLMRCIEAGLHVKGINYESFPINDGSVAAERQITENKPEVPENQMASPKYVFSSQLDSSMQNASNEGQILFSDSDMSHNKQFIGYVSAQLQALFQLALASPQILQARSYDSKSQEKESS